jgi:phage terminase large subunit
VVEAAIDAHKKLGFEPSGRKRLGFDVADSGADKCANVYRYGSVVYWADEWKAKEDELMKSCKRTYNAALERGAEIVYDSIGVGAGSGSKFEEINRSVKRLIPITRLLFSTPNSTPVMVYTSLMVYQLDILNKDFFANLKAQAWWLVADRFRNTYNAVKNGESSTLIR